MLDINTLDCIMQVWTEEKQTRWKELLPAWYNFWTNEPLNTAAMGDIDKNGNRQKLENLFKDFMAYDDLPLIVAWDETKKQVC